MDQTFIGVGRLLQIQFLILAILIPTELRSEALPGFTDMVTRADTVYPLNSAAMPAYLQAVRDSTFGTKVTKITNNSGQSIAAAGASGTWGAIARHHYSKDQPWSSDGALLAIQNKGASPSQVYLDGETYKVRYAGCSNYSAGDDRWHPSKSHSQERINVNNNGSELMWFDVTTCTKTRSWTTTPSSRAAQSGDLPFPVNYFGPSEGNSSADGRFIALTDGARMFVVDMDPVLPLAPYPNRRVGPPTVISDCGFGSCKVDWVSVSPSGKYAVVNYDGDYPRVYDVNPNTLALSVRTMPASAIRCHGTADRGFIYDLGHADMTLNPFDHDEDVIIGQEHCGNRGRTVSSLLIGGVMMVRIRDGSITPLTDPTNEAYPHHVSTRNFDRPGWAYVGYYPEDSKRFADEIIAVKLDGSKAVQRFAQKHSNFSSCYECESHPVPSRDGRRVIWASNWAINCSSCGSSSEVKDYVVDARSPLPGVDAVSPANPRNLREE